MQKYIIFIITIVAIGVYYYSQNLNKLIDSKEAERILDQQINDLSEVILQDIDPDIVMEWEKFSCSSDLVCVSPQITIKQYDVDLIHFKNTTININKIAINEGQGKWSTDIEIDRQFIDMINQNDPRYFDSFKAFIPTSLTCTGSTTVKGKEALVMNDNTCSIITDSAHYHLTLDMDVIHPIYQDETFLSIVQDQTGKFSDEEAYFNGLDQLRIGLRKFSFHVNAKTLAEALYQFYVYSSPDMSKKDFYSEIEQNMGIISFVSDLAIRSDETLSEEDKNRLIGQADQLFESIMGIVTGKNKELQLDITLKDMQKIKRFSVKDLEDGSKNLNHFTINIISK